MWATYIGIFKPGARENPDAYYDRPFDMFEAYYDINVYRLPASWSEVLGKSKQMDWGSWLYVCSKETMRQLMYGSVRNIVHVIPGDDTKEPVREPPIDLTMLPDREWYGILEVEIY